MTYSKEDPIKHKWQRAAKMARGKAPGDEMLRSVKHDQHAESAYKHRFDGSQEDPEQQIDSFFSLK
jgi:hypothetical protein